MLSDQDFLEQFEDKSLDPNEFSHKGHLRLAWLYLKFNAFEEAINKLCKGIKSFASFHGQPNKFHKTITVSISYIIALRLKEQRFSYFDDFLGENIDLIENWRELLKKYYSFDLLENEEARVSFIEPDLKDFNV